MTQDSSEYETKRLRRIAENRQKLQELNIPTLVTTFPLKKRKRKVDEKKPLEPTRKSSRQATKVEKVEPEKWKKLENDKKVLQRELREEKKKKKVGQCEEGEEVDQEKIRHEQVPRILDWRLRRKLQAREERRQVTMTTRDEKKKLRLKEQLKLKKLQLRARKLKQKQKEKDKLEKSVQKELALQRRIEEGELMKEEDRLARKVAQRIVKDEKQKKLDERNAMVNELMEEIVADERQRTREKEDALDKTRYPVQKLDLPLVHVSDPIDSYKTKPLVLSSLLNVDVNLFHAFSLGKQFLPPGKKSVMQGLCPGGFTTAYQDHVDIHVWKNALTLFLSGTTGMFYQYMFEEVTDHGRKYVFFRWTRSRDVTSSILWRLCHVQKGKDVLHLHKRHDVASMPTRKPEPLLLFVQYPKGPYVYCGRLGYLGHQPNPLEFSFQLLDIHALNWKHLRTLLISG